MGKPRTKRDLADAAYLKTETLRGQIDAFDGVQGKITDHPPIFDDGKSPPPVCPHCQKHMDISVGGSWTHLKVWDSGNRLQCDMCGGIVGVSQDVWVQVREAAIKAFVDRAPDKTSYERRKKMLIRDEMRGAE